MRTRTPTFPGTLWVVGPMIALLPIVNVAGPGHTAALDALNIVFLAVYWCWLLARREAVGLPLVVPIWLIVLGSCVGLYAAHQPVVAVVTIVQGLYLYLWFVTLAHLLGRESGAHVEPDPLLAQVITLWAVVAGTLGLLAFADVQFHLLGGVFLESAHRAQGTFENPNMFGNYLVVTFFLTWAAAAAGRPRLYFALPAFVAGVFATASNGALMGLAGGSAAAILFHPAWRSARVRGAVLVVTAAMLLVLGTSLERVRDYVHRMVTADRGEIGGAAAKGYDARELLWYEAVTILRQNPTGIGPGNFQELSGNVAGTYNSAHNEYLGMLVERGPLGLAGWCALLAGVGSLLIRLRRAASESSLAVEPLFGLLAAVAVHAMVVEVFHFRHVWLALALVAAATTRATRRHVVPSAVVWAPARSTVLEGA